MSSENQQSSMQYSKHSNWMDFNGRIAENYHVMPGYPSDAVQSIVARCTYSLPGLVIDLGCGTGGFTRQLAAEFGRQRKIVGLDPNVDMLKQATRLTTRDLQISYLQSAAEEMPFDDQSVAVLTAAGAAHRFNSSVFYPEAARVLVDGGLLVLLHNRPDAARSDFMSDYLDIHEHYVPEYRRDWHSTPDGSYGPLPYERDLSAQSAFEFLSMETWAWTERVPEDTVMALALSSTVIARAALRVGQDKVLREVHDAFVRCAKSDGYVDMPYVTEGLFARRRQRSSN